MYKRFFIICTLFIVCFITISCSSNNIIESTDINSSTLESNKNETSLLYSGFLLVDIEQVNDYAMTNYYVITNEADWNSWNSKYTKDFPYYLENFDWNKNCLITYAYIGSKDLWNTISNPENVSFENDIVDITFNDNIKIYAFNNSSESRHIGMFVIKVAKPVNLTSLDSSFITYQTYSNIK